MSNPIINVIKSGNAPKPGKLAAARGMLPLTQEELLEVLIILRQDQEEDIRLAAETTISNLDPNTLLPIAQNQNSPVHLLDFLASWQKASYHLTEAIILNKSTSNDAIAFIAAYHTNSSLLEAITINQQRLIQHPVIIDAILANPYRSAEAERRAREVKTEFFEKELGAAQVAEEQKARAQISKVLGADISQDEFQNVLAQFEKDMGIKVEDHEITNFDPEAELRRLLTEMAEEGEIVDQEQLSVYQIIAKASAKTRIFMGLKGDRTVRGILIRDSNKLVSSAVVKNPKVTDAEIEKFAKIKGISEDVLRTISMNRAWSSNYTIMHNLTCNPRTPPTFSMTFINRLQLKDLKSLVKDKGVPEVLRNMAKRLVSQRQPN
jgi:arsenate reductase-like glutaredoxin family protein